MQRSDQVRDIMARMREAPPQVVLLEGGDAPSRLAMAEHWARLHNCESGTACGQCAACRQITERTDPERPWERAFRDFHLFDGSASNIKVEWIRRIKPLFAEPPRGRGLRVVVFYEAQQLTQGAANALLKAFEEPNPGTLFVLTAPQRERLLPTLVSRSWVLTLAWPTVGSDDREDDEDTTQWLCHLADFWATGQGWFQRTGGKGSVDKDLALGVVLGCQRELIRVMTEGQTGPAGRFAASLDAEGLRRLDLMLERAQTALTTPTPVNPALVLDWLAVSAKGLMSPH